MPLLGQLQPAPELTVLPQGAPNAPVTPANPTNTPGASTEKRVGVPGRVDVQTDSTTVITNSGSNSNQVGAPPSALVEPTNTLKEQRSNPPVLADTSGSSPVMNSQEPFATPPNLPLAPGRQTENNRPESNTNTPQPNTGNSTNAATPTPDAALPRPTSQTPGPSPSVQPGNPMLIPDAALNSGSTRFLEGSWSAGAGIQDATTGKPVRLEYDFSQGNGQGRVTVKRGDGVQCVGAVGAQMQGRTVQINDRGTAKCTDGSTMALPKVTCTPGAGNQAACQGQYDNGTSFPVSMRHAPK